MSLSPDTLIRTVMDIGVRYNWLSVFSVNEDDDGRHDNDDDAVAAADDDD